MSTDLAEMAEILKLIINECGNPLDIICHSFGLLVINQTLKGQEGTIGKLISIASPYRLESLISTFIKQTGFRPSLQKSLVHSIQKRVHTIQVERDVDVSSQSFSPKSWMMIHDRDDKQVGFSEFEALKLQFAPSLALETEGLGHTRILNDNHTIKQIVQFLNSTF